MSQAMENTAAAVSATAPAKAPNMGAYRDAQFKAMVGKRLQEAHGLSASAVAAAIAEEQRALATAIEEPAFIELASDALLKAQAEANPNPRYQSTPDQARESVLQIMRRRARDARQYASLVERADYYEPIARTPYSTLQSAVPSLRDVKTQELLQELLNMEDGAPQVIAHIDATAKGTMFEHDALARMFSPQGPLNDALLQSFTRLLPQATPEHRAQLAAEWLKARHDAAQMTSDLAANDGEAYRQAVAQSTAYHRQPPKAAAIPPIVTPIATPPHTASTVVTDARLVEKMKTDREKAEDVAYTLNHAISCGLTDTVVAPLVAATVGINIGCLESDHHGHDHHDHAHGHDHHHDHDHKPQKKRLTFKQFGHELSHYLKGEIIGDMLAVPATIFVQRNFPGFMNGMAKLMEPVAGVFFRGGARRDAERWGSSQGLEKNSSEVKEKADEIYRHEIDHLPQAATWSVFAYGLGVVSQKLTGHTSSIKTIMRNKAIGSLVSNSLLLGGRALAPGTAENIDRFNSEHIIAPTTNWITRLMGFQTADAASAKPEENWKTRMEPTEMERVNQR